MLRNTWVNTTIPAAPTLSTHKGIDIFLPTGQTTQIDLKAFKKKNGKNS